MPDTLIAGIPIARVPPDRDMKQTYKKIILRSMPLLFVCYFFDYLDRINVGFAKLQMRACINWYARWVGTRQRAKQDSDNGRTQASAALSRNVFSLANHGYR